MNLKRILLAFAAFGAILCACEKEEDLGTARITVTPSELSLGEAEESATVEILATRDWYISSQPDWIGLSVAEGKASAKPQQVSVSVLANSGHDRTGEVVFSIGFAKTVLTVVQKGTQGELKMGSGTLEDPYTVAGVIAYVESLGKDINSPDKVFVKGKVCRVGDETFKTSGTYGNATFWISDNGEVNTLDFYCFRILYLGNKKYSSGDDIKVGDEVIVCGQVVNYKGNTPETVQGNSFLYSLNGKSEGGYTPSAPAGDPKGSGTQADPYNVAAALDAVKNLSWTSNDVYDKVGPYYIAGKVSRVKDGETFTPSNTFGNATFWISDDGTENNEFQCYRILYLGNKKYTSGDNVKPGDDVVVYAELMNYRGNTPETVQGSGYLYSLNGVTGGNDQPQQPEDPSSVQQITCAEFIAKADQNTTYRLVGEVVSSVNTQYCSFDLNDGTATVVVWTVNNKDDWKDVVKQGGTVTVRGKYFPYTNKDGSIKHEMIDAWIESFSESTTPVDPGTPSGSGTLASPYNAAAANQLASSLAEGEKSEEVYVAGKISSIKHTFDAQYGTATFNISDDGTTSGAQFTCYAVLYLGNTSWLNGQTQVKVGDNVVIYGKLVNYQGNTPESASKEAYIYNLNGQTEPEEVETPEQPSGDFAGNVEWTAGSDASYTQSATVNGTSDVPVLKLGTGSATGKSTLTLPAPSSKLSFYAVSWKGKPSKLVFKVGGTEVASVEPAANDGLASNPPYKLTVTDADHYSIDLGSGVTEVTVETSGSNTRAALFAIVAE